MTISSPTLLLDKATCLSNIRRMAEKAERHGLALKPHFKTHQSAIVGEWFRDFGVTSITVSSVAMAAYFADHGWQDITIAFPVNIRETERINVLAEKINLSLFVIEEQVANYLERHLSAPVGVYIEIDTGANRTGIKPESIDAIEALIDLFGVFKKLNFSGFYSHPGHSYSARSGEEVQAVHRVVLSKMRSLRSHFDDRYDSIKYCIGDTPCCSIAGDFEGLNEISPGNFVFYDLMQVQIGSCAIKDIAVVLASPVVAKYRERNEVVVHGGGVHLSKEYIYREDKKIFGLPVRLSDTSWSEPVKNSFVKGLSQEHGVLWCSNEFFDTLKIGDLVGILPVHSCLTANLMRRYLIC